MLDEVSFAAPTSKPSARSNAVPHSGMPALETFRTESVLPILSGLSVPVVEAYIISPTAYVVRFVPPLFTGTADVKLAGFKKYALSKLSSVPASTTPSLIKT